ncbi:MAG TPA: ABC transporter permease [Longimicrobium sp.]|jgi:predicted permease
MIGSDAAKHVRDEPSRAGWFRGAMEDLVRDLGYAARGLRKTPAFTAVALLTLALGIGANGGLFGLVNALFFRAPAGLTHTDRLLRVVQQAVPGDVSYPEYLELVEGTRSFDGLSASWSTELDLGSGGEPVRVNSALASANYFAVLGVRPALGRGFFPGESRAEGEGAVAVLGHGLWERRFGADPRVVGKSVVVNGVGLTVVGVAPRGFVGTHFEKPAELWIPATMLPGLLPGSPELLRDRGFDGFALAGRIRGGVEMERAEAELARVSRRIDLESPEREKDGYEPLLLRAEAMRGWFPVSAARRALPLLAFAWLVTGLVLLVSCANLANLLLARAIARRREIGIRLALGVAQGRLVRLLLTETFLLALSGGALGLAASLWAAELFQARLLRDFEGAVAPLDISPDLSTLLFAIALTTATGLLFGLVPALYAARGDVMAVLKGNGATGLRRTRLQGALVVAQTALSLVLLVSAGFFVRKLQGMSGSNLGYDTENVLAVSLDLGSRGHSEAARRNFYQELRGRSERLPGVMSATAPTVVPLGRQQMYRGVFNPSSAAPATRESQGYANAFWSANVGPGFFRTLGIPVLRGRGIEERDVQGAARVAVVSQSVANRFWPGEDPIGKFIVQRATGDTLIEVVGVAGEINSNRVGAGNEPHVYTPATQIDRSTENLLLRTTGDPGYVVRSVRNVVRGMDPSLPVIEVRTLASAAERQIRLQRGFTAAITAFGGLALLLAACGLYGVIAFTVAGRAREIGVRMAVGARDSDVVRVFLRDGMRLTVIGVVIGGTLALGAGMLIRSAVDGMQPFDPALFAGVAAILMAATLVATLVPARRATRVDPMASLRAE